MTNENRIDKVEHRRKGRGRKAFWMVLGIVFLVSLFWAIDGPRREPGRLFSDSTPSDRRLDRVLDALDVDTQQRGILLPILRRFQSELAQIRAEEVALRIDFSDALESGTLRTEDISRLQSAAAGLSETAIASAFQLMVDSWEVLTPQQRAEVLRHWEPRG